MPSYQYRAKDRAGNTVTGNLDADSESATADELQKLGLWPMKIQPTGRQAPTPAPAVDAAPPRQVTRAGTAPPPTVPQAPALPKDKGEWNAPPVPLKDLAVYFRQLAAAVHSGMPLARCMDVMREQSRGTLQRLSAEGSEAISRGQPLTTVFARHPRLISPLILATIRAGEVGGLLDVCMNRIADMLERQYALDQRIKHETFMPKLTLGMGVVISIAVKVVMRMIGGEGAAFGATFGNVLVPAVGTIACLYFLPTIIARFGVNSRFIDQLKLSIPVIGKVTRTVALARFSRGFASLYRAGVSVPESISTAAAASGNQVIAERIRMALPAIHRGERMADALAPTNALPPMAMNMLRTGEETGNVDDMLDKVADYAEADAETAMRNMATMLGPMLLLLIGALVAIEVARFFLNYFNTVLNFAG